jgi:hypothetical protein
MKRSTATNNAGFVANDVSANSAAISLFDNNTVGSLSITNSGVGYTDGTNNITTGGSSLTKLAPQ